MVTTESATEAATFANRPAGCSELPSVDSVTFEVVNASTTSAVLRPTQPPAIADHQRDDRQHRQRDVGHPAAEQHVAHAELADVAAAAGAGAGVGTAGVPSAAAAPGSRHGSSGSSGSCLSRLGVQRADVGGMALQ